MVERLALRVTPVGMLAVWAGVESQIGAIAADVDGRTAVAGGAAPAFVPAEDRRQQARGAFGVADGDIYMLDEGGPHDIRSEEHTSELQSLMRSSYAVFC